MTLHGFIAEQPLCIDQEGELWCPLHLFATAAGDGVGFVTGEALDGRGGVKACHVVRGKVTVAPDRVVIEAGGSGIDPFTLALEPGSTSPRHAELVALRERVLREAGYSRERALRYLKDWFPGVDFIP